MTSHLHELEILQLAKLIAARKVSSLEVTQEQLNRISRLDGTLGAYAVVMAESALEQADAADKEIAAGRYRGPLHGIPIAVKDLFWTKSAPTAAGMAIYRNYYPNEDATVVRRLIEAGAVILGKLQMTEGAYSDYHPSVTSQKNPWNADFWTGISSSGPGVAIAAGLCYGAPASDTGGSIRWPSGANGVTGLKPSWGRVSRHGMFALAPSLDHVGAMARSAADVGAILDAMAGPDPLDPTALQDVPPDCAASIGRKIEGLRIGVDHTWNSGGVDPAVLKVLAQAIKVFVGEGARMVNVTFPDVAQTVADWALNCAVETAVAHEATYPSRKAEYGAVLASVLEAGRALSSLDYQKILLRRMDLRGRIDALFADIDLLLIPVQPFAPPSLETIRTLGEQPDLIAGLQRYTCPFDMSGHPTITLPGGFTDEGLPIGFQLAAGHLNEAQLIQAGVAFQHMTQWHRRRPVEKPDQV
jgi:amidase